MSTPSDSNPPLLKGQFADLNEGGTYMDQDKWEEVWQRSMIKFHLNQVHPMLKQFYQTLVGGNSKRQTIFLPMCGKSLDLNWLAEKGHKVVGVEYVELACRQFYDDHNIPYIQEPIKTIPGQVFKSKDSSRNVIIYCCDFYKVTKSLIGTFDACWDRASLAAINPPERQMYADTMMRLLSPGNVYLVDAFLVDNSKFAGPPFNLPLKELRTIFGSHCSVDQLAERDAMTDWQRSWGVDYFYENVYSIKFHG